MVPKIIHYCWFSKEEVPPLIKKCIQSWKKHMPDYKIKLWDSHSFDFSSVPFVKEAYEAKKWAFVTDYVRLYALYTEGGIYLDSDVRILKSLDPFLNYNFFTAQEYIKKDYLQNGIYAIDKEGHRIAEKVMGLGIQAAIMGAEKGCPFLKDCLDYYQNIHFNATKATDFVIVNIIARIMEKYGYKYILTQQNLEGNMVVMPPFTFSGMQTLTDQTFAVHLCNGSWTDGSLSFRYKIRNHYPLLYSTLQKISYAIRGKKFKG